MSFPLLLAIITVGPPSTTVGMSGTISHLVLPAPEVEVVPLTGKNLPMVVWIDAVYKHGTSFRYDLGYYGLEPGQHDLKKYLRRKDGGSLDAFPSIPVDVTTTLPAGQVLPSELDRQGAPFIGGYRFTVYLAMAAWCVGLFVILFWGRQSQRAIACPLSKPRSVADRLRPLVVRAMAGQLSRAEQASLERTLYALWRKRLGLEDADPRLASEQLRAHPDAGIMVMNLESWLHQPPGSKTNVDVETLLKPYQSIDETAFDAAEQSARHGREEASV